MTAGALANPQDIATALQQARPSGRHRKGSHAARWTMPRQQYAHAAADQTKPRHRKPPRSAVATSGPRHRKTGRGNSQAVYPSFRIGQDNPIRTATRRAAIPSALALGMLAMGGAISGSFSTPLIDASQADGRDPGRMTHGAMPPPPALTARATPSVEAAAPMSPRADRGVRAPVIGAGFVAWPVVKKAATEGVGEPAQNGTTTTTVRDDSPRPAVFAPRVLADSPGGARGGGGGRAETSAPPEPPSGGGPLSGLFPPDSDGGDAVDPNTGAPSVIDNDDSAAPGDAGNRGDHRADRPRRGRGGDEGGSSGSRRASDAGGPGSSGRDNRGGGDHSGGDGGRGGGRH